MIYLIGGAPRSGKSMLAERLGKQLNLPYVSTDDLEEEVRDRTPEQEWHVKFPKTVIRKQSGFNNDEMYLEFTIEEIVEAYIRQSEAVWDEVSKLAKKEDYIVEGYHIHPALVIRLREEVGVENVKSVFLTRKDTSKTVEEATKFASEEDWFTKQTKDEPTYPKMAKMISRFSQFFEKEAEINQLKIISMDNHFESGLKEALDYLRS
ncbi:MAG: hypothetical protein Q8P99_00080 [bacterium]|nr:hypothetical protein [bacterium]